MTPSITAIGAARPRPTLRETIGRLAPGTPLRDGLERILRRRTGALIVLGYDESVEAICDGGDVTYFVNGVKVMEGRDGSFKSGKLLFQSEGAEIFFRLIELHPLK